eukprot:PhF_6_TR42798/c0_g1_i1/m.64769/K21813/ENDOV; endonuclease V
MSQPPPKGVWGARMSQNDQPVKVFTRPPSPPRTAAPETSPDEEDVLYPLLDPMLQSTRAVWRVEQREIARQVVLRDEFPAPITHIGGTDISFVPGTNTAVACVVSLTYPELKVVASSMHIVELKVPYICNYLAFREVGPLAECIEKFKKDHGGKGVMPQVWIVDGNGVWHPRKAGLASHFGVVCDLATIGVSKKLLTCGVTDRDIDEALARVEHGHAAAVKGLGHVALFGNSVRNPVYISPGHKVSFETAAQIVMSVATARVPEPTRQADLLSRAYIRKNFKGLSGGDEH